MVSAVLDKKEIGVGEKVTLTVEMKWKQNDNYSIIVEKFMPPTSIVLEQVDSKQQGSSQFGENGIFYKKVMQYIFVGKEKGTGELSPVVVEYTLSNNPEDKKIIRTQMLSIKVVPTIKRVGNLLLKFLVGLLLLSLFCFVFILLGRIVRMREGKKKNDKGEKLYPEEKCCTDLRELNKHKVSGAVGVYYLGVEKLLTEYVEVKYNRDLSAEETKNIPEELKKICSECRTISEKVRFSGYRPQSNEENRLIRRIEKYMKSLIPQDKEEESIETIY